MNTKNREFWCFCAIALNSGAYTITNRGGVEEKAVANWSKRVLPYTYYLIIIDDCHTGLCR